MITDAKRQALATHLDCHADDFQIGTDLDLLVSGDREYLVLTDKQANERAVSNIRESMWAFNADFIVNHMRNGPFNANGYTAMKKAITLAQTELCEDANPLIEALIGSFAVFASDAVTADGRAHFMNTYDDQEIEVMVGKRAYYIYRVA